MLETKVCNKCNIAREFTYTGFKKGDGTRLFKDDTGRKWHGRSCSRCHRGGEPRVVTKSVTPRPMKTRGVNYWNRRCKKCLQKLTIDRYFHCVRCVPSLEMDFNLQDAYGACTISGTTLRY